MGVSGICRHGLADSFTNRAELGGAVFTTRKQAVSQSGSDKRCYVPCEDSLFPLSEYEVGTRRIPGASAHRNPTSGVMSTNRRSTSRRFLRRVKTDRACLTARSASSTDVCKG